MRSKSIICLLFISLVLGIQCRLPGGRIYGESGGAKGRICPEGFKLLAALPEMDGSVNMTDYIKGFRLI